MTTPDSTTPARTVAAPAGQLAHATSLTRSGRFAEAGALLLPLSKTHPSDPLVHRALGELFAARRDPRAALSHLQLACRLAPGSATNALELGRLQAATGDFDGARRSFGQATQLDPALFDAWFRSEEHTSELQSLMRISYAVFCLKKKNKLTQPSK